VQIVTGQTNPELDYIGFSNYDTANMIERASRLKLVQSLRRPYAASSNEKFVYYIFYVVRTVRFGMKLYNDKRTAQIFYLFIYLLLPYMFRAFFKPIFRGRFTNSAVVLVCWVWCQRPALTPYPIAPSA
jgi:hypothetical protein